MEIRILGPLTVTEAGREVAVPGGRPRLLLAALALQPRRVVPVSRLVDGLWGAHLPADPVNALQALVSRLRRSLPRDGAVVSRSPGYLLDVGEDDVDALRFERLAAAGREALAQGRPEAAAATLREALAEWRGPALAEFAEAPFARPFAVRLEELRSAALEDRVEADLALGAHAQLVGELEGLVAASPLRERLRGQLMRALHGSGRQADALAVYRQGRKVLAEEAGLDPGPELRRLEAAVLDGDAEPAAPPAPGVGGVRGNLRVPLTSFVGRDAEVAEVRALLTTARLVTLTGPGGAGKTRLATAVAADVASAFPDGTWLVELAPLADPEGVPGAVAAVLGLRSGPPLGAAALGLPLAPAERLQEFLAARRTLLVLDNCEHVVEAVARLAETLLAACPDVRILATSREALGVPAERRWPVPALRVPPAGLSDPERLDDYGATRLFVERARAAQPSFVPGPPQAAAVTEICHRLDGLPLAIELAAARVPALSVEGIAARLDDRFRLLTAGSRTAMPRQRTLRAVVDWSWDLLEERERTVLARLSVFAGGCTLEAAEQVCAAPGLSHEEVLDVLARLVDKSLLVAGEDPAGQPRYRLLETVRTYAAARLAEEGGAEAARRAHARAFLDMAVTAERGLHGGQQLALLDRLEREHDNVRAALRWALDAGEGPIALGLTAAMGWFWWLRGHRMEMGPWVREALALDGAPSAQRAWSLAWYSFVAWEGPEGLDGGLRAAEEGRTIALALDDPRALAFADIMLAFNLTYVGEHDRAGGVLDEAVAAAQRSGDAWETATALMARATIGLYRGDHAGARDAARLALPVFQSVDDRWGVAMVLEVLSHHAEVEGDYDAAVRTAEESLALVRELGLRDSEPVALARLGNLLVLRGDLPGAKVWHERARAVSDEMGQMASRAFTDSSRGFAARRRGDLDEARALIERALDYYRGVSALSGLTLCLSWLTTLAELRGDLDEAAALAREALATAEKSADRRAVALALEATAGVAAARGDAERAAELLGEAAAARAALGTPLPPGERFEVDRITAAARARLGDQQFAAAYARGGERGAGGTPGPAPVS